MDPRLDDSLFHHRFTYRVRSHECDRQGIVHNARYLEILEIARIEFSREVFNMKMDTGIFVTHDKFFTVRNAIDYFNPAMFDEELIVLTRISKVGKTSATFEQIVNSVNRKVRVIEAESVVVHVDPRTNMPIDVDADFRRRVSDELERVTK
jgi:acyl-CoA thioester hydrolase